MNKPITMQIKEFKDKIVQDINTANLPFFILDTTFRDLYNEIHMLAVEQEEKEKQEYEQFLIEEQNKKNKSEEPTKK